MTTLGILFGQQRAVIGVKDEGLGGEIGKLQGILRQTFGGVAGIVIDASVSEEHVSTMDLTDNEVEEGVDVTDHARLKPAQLTMDCVISDTPLGYAVIGNIQNVVRSVSTLFGGTSRSIDAYNDLLALQKTALPFTVYTGLRRYTNMILTELTVPRTAETGGALHFKASMREIRIVSSQNVSPELAVNVSSLGSGTKDKGNKITPPVDPGGTLNPESSSATTSGSLLFRLTKWLVN